MAQRRGKQRTKTRSSPAPASARRPAARQSSAVTRPRGRRPTGRYWLAMLLLLIVYQALFVLILHRSIALAIGVLLLMAILVVTADRAFNLGRYFFK